MATYYEFDIIFFCEDLLHVKISLLYD